MDNSASLQQNAYEIEEEKKAEMKLMHGPMRKWYDDPRNAALKAEHGDFPGIWLGLMDWPPAVPAWAEAAAVAAAPTASPAAANGASNEAAAAAAAAPSSASVAAQDAAMIRELHDPMRAWYNAPEQAALRAKHGPYPSSAQGLESWGQFQEVTVTFLGTPEVPPEEKKPAVAAAPAVAPAAPPPLMEPPAKKVRRSRFADAKPTDLRPVPPPPPPMVGGGQLVAQGPNHLALALAGANGGGVPRAPMTQEQQQELLVLQMKMRTLQERTMNFDQEFVKWRNDPNRGPDPPPIYGPEGKRVNTPEVVFRQQLQRERTDLMTAISKIEPQTAAALGDQPKRPTRKLYIPVREFPNVCFMGLILGRVVVVVVLLWRSNCFLPGGLAWLRFASLRFVARKKRRFVETRVDRSQPLQNHHRLMLQNKHTRPRGNHHKRMERDSFCKIRIRGKGSLREGSRGKDLQRDTDDDKDDLHVYIEGPTEDAVQRATEMVEPLLNPESKAVDELKEIHQNELATINGTARVEIYCHICGEKGHQQWECPAKQRSYSMANVRCALCGDTSHPTRDCVLNKKTAEPGVGDNPDLATAQSQKVNSEFLDFMSQLGEQPGLGFKAPAKPAPAPSAQVPYNSVAAAAGSAPAPAATSTMPPPPPVPSARAYDPYSAAAAGASSSYGAAPQQPQYGAPAWQQAPRYGAPPPSQAQQQYAPYQQQPYPPTGYPQPPQPPQQPSAR